MWKWLVSIKSGEILIPSASKINGRKGGQTDFTASNVWLRSFPYLRIRTQGQC